MAVAINAIRRLESKIEDLTTAINTPKPSSALPFSPAPAMMDHHSPSTVFSQPNPGSHIVTIPPNNLQRNRLSIHELAMSPQVVGTSAKSPVHMPEVHGAVDLSFSQHRVALWPAIKQILPSDFVSARAELPEDYIVDRETCRPPLPMHIDRPYGTESESWLMSLPQSAVKGLADAYFAVFHRNMPVLDKYHFFSSTLGMAMEKEFGYDLESALVLNVLALGCLAVKAHEEGDFALTSRQCSTRRGFIQPEWYALITDDPPGLNFFNEARKRLGFLMCQNDLQAGQFYMLSTLYYAQILRPLDSWTTVNRAALCCASILARTDTVDYETWEGDMLSRLFWCTLMYETVITQELDLLPHSGLLEYEPDIPLPKFAQCPRPKTSISGLLTDENDSLFNFHFLAQAAHRILLTRVKQSVYTFAEKDSYPSASLTAEMHHQLEQWRANLPPSLQFSDQDDASDSPSPAHVIAKAMLRSRYLVAKLHIGRPFLYKALHAPAYTNEAEYDEVRKGLRGGMYWPTTMGLCTQMLSALPIKFGWCCQCFGQVLLFHAVARSPDPKLRETLPGGWREWVTIMMTLIESCARSSPGIAKDYELLRLLDA
ncbi:C6 zinc finger domain containing protein [Pyrenophora tritici-repentis]|nr:C6 zinc finger domain containing protein [Pyrenophora tritici-repentis]KAF7576342.1 C6 zinc finger domain containing protein [Pyrenophora tritici-repentis]KAG9377266.1 C6 zinc finger domain containing protein [Pyrenophora tritici-repentis]KAI0584928.1 C6 zinc finger domain-containing protein [Pyrenophora tritici-repentis]KAI0590650.1 C6 zinc finger domain-containing protein [Pyrenophora tritici-repentis]